MEKEQLLELNRQIASLHDEGDVYSYEFNPSKMIEFPRGFLRSLDQYRSYLPFITNRTLRTKIANQLMHRDTLHWIWLKTDIYYNAYKMVVKHQLINLATIVEAIVVFLTQNAPRKVKNSIYERLDYLHFQALISEEVCKSSKNLWKSRRQIHLHLIENDGDINFNHDNYVHWHESVRRLISELQENVKI